MSIADLIRRMTEAGAPMEAVIQAVEALEIEREKKRVETASYRKKAQPITDPAVFMENIAENHSDETAVRCAEVYTECRQSGMDVWNSRRQAIIDRDGYECAYCCERTDRPHIDHIVPISRGGSNGWHNLTVACAACNISKGARLPIEWQGRR